LTAALAEPITMMSIRTLHSAPVSAAREVLTDPWVSAICIASALMFCISAVARTPSPVANIANTVTSPRILPRTDMRASGFIRLGEVDGLF